MNHVLFEEDGSFKAGTVLSDAGTSLQVEHASGKRTKVKTGSVLMRFDAPDPGSLMSAAQRVADDVDIDFLWECAPQDEFGFTDLAAEYFGGRPDPAQSAGLLFKLHSAPVYFHRKGRGRYRPAPRETVRLALAAIERRRQQELEIDAQAQAMVDGRLPEGFERIAAALLVRPDKQSLAYRALERACERTKMPPERLLLALGAFASPRELHFGRFVAEHFPNGVAFDAVQAPRTASDLPMAPVEAFSIDDSSTTEIDDALSVQTLPGGRLRVGVHIAAPALAIDPGDRLDALARERMSTVYMPGDKLTMLPEVAIRPYSLDADTVRPALSMYADLDADGTAVQDVHSRVERVRVAANLRHDLLDDVVTEAALDDPAAAMPFGDALRALWRLTLALSADRDRVRGKPEARFRTDFGFHVDGDRVRIVQRRRDAPLDRIVAEMMILVNSRWGRMLADHAVAGIYRSQQGTRVRMSTQALAHQGLGVDQYVWASSPLRRYVDLTNQRQLVALLYGEKPPFAANDAELFSIISAFEARHAAYAEFQTRMERYWCLRWLDQQGLARVDAVVVRDDLVRLAQAPFYFRLADVPRLAPGRRIVVDILSRDEIELSVQARFVDVAADAPEGEATAGGLTAAEADEAEFAEEG